MPDNTQTPEPTNKPEIWLTVKRNETELPFVKETKSRGDVTRQKDKNGNDDPYYLLKGESYPSPLVTEENLISTVIPWLSPKIAAKMIGAKLDQWAQGLTEEVKEQRGVAGLEWDDAVFAALAEQFSPRGEPLAELMKQREDCLIALEAAGDDAAKQQAAVKEVLAINAAIKSKKRMTKEEKEKIAQAANA